jgi:MoxR-like ATPase
VLKLVRSARPQDTSDKFVKDNVAWGPSPRASQALMLGAKARALLDGRLSPSIDDVLQLATPVMRHRMAVTFAARQDGVSLDDVIVRLTEPLR